MADETIHIRLTLSGVRRLLWLPAVLVLSVTVQAADDTLITIQDRIWGFDGRVQVGQFNPVSFLIDNRTDEAVDAVAALSNLDGLGSAAGGRYEQPVFIGPGAQRWVQLYPYISTDDQADWVLHLGQQQFRGLRQPRSTTTGSAVKGKPAPLPAAIILDAPGTMSLKPATVKHFPEEIFPPWATATVGLHTIFMDHVPDWEEPRQRALMSWLRRGGRLHLLKNSRGVWPEFSGAMADLSQPLNRFSVGSGLVTRHSFQRGDLSESIVRSALTTETKEDPDELSDEELTVYQGGYAVSGISQSTDPGWLDDTWFDAMRRFTQPDHAWAVIFLLSLIYIAAIFPGCWLLARQNRHFLTVYGTIVGLSVVFSLLFLVIGRRGYGEHVTQHTIAVSRVVDNSTQSVLEWNSLFVTSGDEYTVSGTNEQAMFAVPGRTTETNAVMTAGNDGQLSVPIPPFSAQTFLCRREVPLADWGLTILSSRRTGDGIADLQLQYGSGLDIDSDAQIHLQHGRYLYRVSCDHQLRQLKQTGRIGSMTRFCHNYNRTINNTAGWGYYADDTVDDFYDALLPAVIMRSMADDGILNPRHFSLPPDRVRLYLYTTLPKSHFIETHTNPRQAGRILYVRDILLRSETTMAAVPDGG